MLTAGVIAFCGVLTALPYLDWSIAEKLSAAFVSPQSAAVLSLGILVFQIPNCQTIYVRAHKREPFLIPSLIVSACVATSVTVLGVKYGIAGAAIAWTCVVVVVQLPLWTTIWRKTRAEALQVSRAIADKSLANSDSSH
jgi:O-antigen/teichoic acid export membrane protein